MSTDKPVAGVAYFTPKDIEPTDEQLAIQTARERTIIVKANAGAAKTTTLALRLAESLQRNVRATDCIALTHTQPACRALTRSLRKMGVADHAVKQLRIQTFEEFCSDVLREMEQVHVPVLAEDEELRGHFWEAVERVENDESERWRDELCMPSIGDSWFVEEFMKMSARLKGTMRDILEREEQCVDPDYAASIGVEYTQLKVYLAYERIRRRENADTPLYRGAMDATYDLARLLHQGETVTELRTWPNKAKVVVVDEMHDLNQAMFKVLMEVLNTTPSFFCGMGDVDQVVLEAAGADAIFMDKAIEAHSNRQVKTYPLTHSYRFSNALAIKARRLADKPYSSNATHDTKVETGTFTTAQECADLVVDAALKWKAQPRAKMHEFAILLRHPWQSVLIENRLLEDSIPYVLEGFESYLMRPEVLFVRGILAVATDNLESLQSKDIREKVLGALLFFSGSKISVEGREGESQAELLAAAVQAVNENPIFLTSFFENQVLRNTDAAMRKKLEAACALARTQTGPAFLDDLLDTLNIRAIISDAYLSKHRRAEALANIEGLKLAAKKFISAFEYFEFLNELEQTQRASRPEKKLLLASIVSVKGWEFDHVVIPHLTQGEFPAPEGTGREERNLLYVGITRTRRVLTLLAHAERPSVFMDKMMGKEPRP